MRSHDVIKPPSLISWQPKKFLIDSHIVETVGILTAVSKNYQFN